jgi:hypothetical protein
MLGGSIESKDILISDELNNFIFMKAFVTLLPY